MALVAEEGGARQFLPQGANMGDYVMTEGTLKASRQVADAQTGSTTCSSA